MPLTERALAARRTLLELLTDPEYLDHYRCHGLVEFNHATKEPTRCCPIAALALAQGWTPTPAWDDALDRYVHIQDPELPDPYELTDRLINEGLPLGLAARNYSADFISDTVIWTNNDSDRLANIIRRLYEATPQLRGDLS